MSMHSFCRGNFMSRSYRRIGAGALGALFAVVFTVTLASARQAHAAGCSLASTNGTVTRLIGARTYTLHVPAGLAGPQVPLLLSMHGASGFSAEQEFVTGWSPYADAHRFIVAYPQGVSNLWDIQQNSYDVTFLRQLVADISGTWCVDPHRVFSDGHSKRGHHEHAVGLRRGQCVCFVRRVRRCRSDLAGRSVP